MDRKDPGPWPGDCVTCALCENVIVPGPNFTDFPVEYWPRDKAKLPLVKFIITLAIVSNTAGITYALKPSPALSWVIKKVQSSGRPCFNPVNVIL